MLWAAAVVLLMAWFVLLIGGIFLGGLVHLLLLGAAGLAAWRLWAVPREA